MGSSLNRQVYLTEHNYMSRAYLSIIRLATLMHLLYSVVYGWSGYPGMSLYNIGSVLFYICAGLGIYMGYDRATVAFAHIEVCVFVILSVTSVGWGYGFELLLISISSLVYFCPFRHRYIPYFFSVAELILFLLLKLHTYIVPMDAVKSRLDGISIWIFLFNACSSFVVILMASLTTCLSSKMVAEKLLNENEDLSVLAAHDSLTGLLLRRCMEEKLYRVWEWGRIHASEFTLVMCDIDDFKRINDTYGHECGDMVLREISSILSGSGAVVCRWGGEEFLLLFKGNRKEDAEPLAQSIRKSVMDHTFLYHGIEIRVTMTFGLADSREADNTDALIVLADQRLYHGKRSGKNRVMVD